MAARAGMLGDIGESSPEHWEKPLGSADVHVVLTALAPDTERLDAALARARQEYQKISGITAIWSQHCHALPNEREALWIQVTGSVILRLKGLVLRAAIPWNVPLRPGEFVLGYPDEMGGVPSIPEPDVLGRNGSYVVFRKLHQRVAAFRQYLSGLPRLRRRRTPGREDDGTLAQRRTPRRLPAAR